VSPLGRARARAAGLGTIALVLVALLPASGLAQSPEPPPPTPVVLPGGGTSPSPFVSTLRTPPPAAVDPDLRAPVAVLADLDTGQVLFNEAGNERRPIASITKITTALLVLERTQPDEVVTVSDEAAGPRVAGISGLGLFPGERIRVHELMYALMLQSANDAAIALAEHVSGTVPAFVELMNARAAELGMTRTRFDSPNGLDETGYSTARDLVLLTRASFGAEGFAEIVSTRFHTVISLDAEPRRVQNRNVLLWLYPGATGVKTGFTSEAGFCLVAAAEREGVRLVSIVLGEPGEPFSEAAELLNYGFAAFERRTLITQGETLGTVDLGGHDVDVVSGGSLRGLVPVEAQIERVIALNERVAFPPALAEEIGTVRVLAGDKLVGEVPLLVAGLPPPPEPGEEGPWWARAIGSVIEAAGAVVDALFG
jgi:D-alanyl-D-alanine carboxypeptidase (penicillin-binding protein 5/6)